ncbi:hypothetical protein BSL78_28098, partial [Apostichopus japonicus]
MFHSDLNILVDDNSLVGGESFDCPERCQANVIEVTKQSFCKSKYAFFAKVESFANYNSEIRVEISSVDLLRKKSYIRELGRNDRVVLQRQAYACSCPDL